MSDSSQRRSSSSATSSGLRSMPARQTTSGTSDGNGNVAADGTVDPHQALRRANAEAVESVLVLVGIQTQARRCPYFQQGQRLRQARQHRQQRRAPGGLVGLGAALAHGRGEIGPMTHGPIAERGRRRDRAAEILVAAKSRLGCRFGSGKSSSNRSSSWSSATAAASSSYAGDSSRLSRANSRYLWAVFTVTRCQGTARPGG